MRVVRGSRRGRAGRGSTSAGRGTRRPAGTGRPTIVVAMFDLVAPHLLGHPRPFHGVDPDPGDDVIVAVGAPGLSGREALISMPSGSTAPPGTPMVHGVLNPVDPKRAHRLPVEIPCHQVPVPEAEPEPRRSHPPPAVAVGERGRGMGAHGLEEVDQRPGVTSAAMGRTSPSPVAPNFKSASRPLGSAR